MRVFKRGGSHDAHVCVHQERAGNKNRPRIVVDEVCVREGVGVGGHDAQDLPGNTSAVQKN